MSWRKWKLGDPVTINRIVWGESELGGVQGVFERDWFGPSHYAGEFEKSLCCFIGIRHAQLTNSGSSALLLATRALQEQGRWRPGDLILHPACTFPTSVNPVWQTDMVPVFVDVEEGTYNVDADQVAQALREFPKIKGAIIPHLIGNVPEMDKIKAVLGDRPIIEDCCDTLGSKYCERMCGTLGTAAAFSFYGSHHITTAGVGGALLTDNADLHSVVHSMAFWGRQFVETGDPYYDFTQRYTYETVGYDMQMTEIQAAFGVAQMGRLEDMNRKRAAQFAKTDAFFQAWEEWLVLPRQHRKAEPSWFGYPVLVRETAPFRREDFARHLLDAKIEVRPLFAGNLTRQPAYRNMPYTIVGDLTQSDRNMERAFFLPSWGGMTGEMTAYMFGIVKGFMGEWT
ncbi:MAG: DegT/DnrJ/EryC1/StrS family aminotransferase [Dehalococcoidales bacterium]